MPDNNITLIIRHYYTKLKTFLFSRNALSFFLFLLLSASFWFVNALDKEREIDINVPFRLVGLPKNIVITDQLPSSISLKLKDEGLKLFSYSNKKLKTISIDISGNYSENGEIYITSNQLYKKLEGNFLSTTQILDIKPDSILVKYEKLHSKTVPIKLLSKINLAPQYMLSRPIQIEPSQLTVYGRKSELDSLVSVQTDVVILKNFKDSTYLSVHLKPTNSIIYNQDSVKINVSVEMFTEKTFEIPITPINCPKSLIFRTFPTVVKVIFNVGIKNFNLVKKSDILVYINYNDLLLTKSGKHKLSSKSLSPLVSNIRIVPNEVEYLLEEVININ